MKKVFFILSLFSFLFLGFVLALKGFGSSVSQQSWRWFPSDPDQNLETVFLEEMTWVEVRDALLRGKKSVIIPTGGIEQNGPHLPLGKHQTVIRYTSGKIAESLGSCLVAPVISYTPEGDITKKEGHMRFPGTISLSPEHFEGLLRDAAKSLVAHGFRNIYFMGDSFDNQESQEKVAKELNEEFSTQGIYFLNVSDYYFKNGQKEWLESRGNSSEEIGYHAGIRDTSEMLAISPESVRLPLIKKKGGAFSAMTGVAGDPTKASPQLGKKLLQLKIKAALNQITSHSKSTQRQ